MAHPVLDVVEAEKALCAVSLVDFVRRSWHVLEPGQPYIHGWHVEAICEHLEAITAGEINRLLINVPPGTMKSTLVSVFWPAWEWGPRGLPFTRFIGASHEQDLAIRDARRMRTLVTSDWFQTRWPLVLTGDQNEKKYYENSATGFRQACAVKSMTGRRGDRVAWDDPHSVEGAISDADREVALRVFQETLPTRLNNPDSSAIVVVMQRLHEMDVAGFILQGDYGYTHLCLPMEFEVDRRCVTSIGFEDPRTEEGALLFPERFPREVVERDKRVMGDAAVAGQFQQRPTSREGGDFKVANIQIVDALPAGLNFTRGWDLAGTTKKRSDYTASVRIAVGSDGVTWISNAHRFKGKSDEVERAIIQTAEVEGSDTFFSLPQDPGQAGVAQVTNLSRKLAGKRFEFTPESGDKRVRAAPLAAQVNVGNVKMLRGDWNDAFLHELSMFPNGAHDDQVDAASRAYNRASQTYRISVTDDMIAQFSRMGATV